MSYKKHHDAKTLGQFFPRLYEDYFALWPPTPTPEVLEAMKNDMNVAVAKVQSDEETVRDFDLTE